MSISRILGRHCPPGQTVETAVHHAISYLLAQARIADLRRRAQRNTQARAALRARPGQRGHAAPGAPDLIRRPRRRPSPRTVLAIASLGGAVAFVDATIVNIAFQDIARSLTEAERRRLHRRGFRPVADSRREER